jgi:hypothetical protein
MICRNSKLFRPVARQERSSTKRYATRVLLATAVCAFVQASKLPAQSTADSMAIVRAVVPQALLHAKHQASLTDTLVAFRQIIESVASRAGYQLLARAAASQPIALADLAPRCAWTGGSPTRGMGIHVSRPVIESTTATLEVELLCMKSAASFAWLFRYRLERTATGWVVRAVEELEIT